VLADLGRCADSAVLQALRENQLMKKKAAAAGL